MKNFLVAMLSLPLVFTLVACGSTPENEGNTENNGEQEVTTTTEQDGKIAEEEATMQEEIDAMYEEYSAPEETDIGTITAEGFGYSDTFNIDGTDSELKPHSFEDFDFYVVGAGVLDMTLNEDGMAYFNSAGPLKMIVFEVKLHNTSDKDVFVDLSQTTLKANNLEEVYIEPAFADFIDVILTPDETVEGSFAFVVETSESITEMTMNHDDESFVFDVLPLREALEKDYQANQ